MLQRGSACGGSSDIGSDCAKINKKKEKNKKSPYLQHAYSVDILSPLHYLRLLEFGGQQYVMNSYSLGEEEAIHSRGSPMLHHSSK